MSGWLLGAGILGCLFLALWGALWWFIPKATPWLIGDDYDGGDDRPSETILRGSEILKELSEANVERGRRQEFTDAWLKKKAKQ